MGELRKTKQKKVLEEELQTFHSFFTAEDLHRKIHTRDNKVGIATVYRFLKSLVVDGRIHSFMCERKALYSTSKLNHCHFRCEHCSAVKHITVRDLNFLDAALREKVCHVQIDITGLCKDCSAK